MASGQLSSAEMDQLKEKVKAQVMIQTAQELLEVIKALISSFSN